MKVLAFGEILWDIIQGEEHLGGAPFNFAAHSAQCGNQSFMISRLGKDRLGFKAFEMVRDLGVNNSLIQWDDKFPTGIVDVTLDGGQPDYVIRENAAYDFISLDETLSALGDHVFDIFYFGSLAQRSDDSFKTLHAILKKIRFTHVFYDVNLRKGCYDAGIVRNSLSACNICKLNTDEVPVISKIISSENLSREQFGKRLTELYPNINIVIITAAEKGCYVFDRNQSHYLAGVPVKMEDAVGAGDAFSAAFMQNYSKTLDIVAAGKIANLVGAYVTTKRGAIPKYSDEIKRFLDESINSVSDWAPS